MRFYLGTHNTGWLGRLEIPLFVSHQRLRERSRLPRASAPWALDSGGFTELSRHHGWRTTVGEYLEAVERYRTEVGLLEWAAPMDWMCEPQMLERTGLTVREHQERTVANYLELRGRGPFVPVLQGWTLDDYERCVELYASAGVDLRAEPRVGVGTICRRQATPEIRRTVCALAGGGLRLHGFGVKKLGLPAIAHVAATPDVRWRWSASRRLPELFVVGSALARADRGVARAVRGGGVNAETIDGCAGPGGWDEAARQLELDPLGIEIDDAACATRRARGHRTLQADLTSLDPGEFAPVRRMIFSPPCPSFSMAGKGEGRSAIPLYQEAMVRMAIEGKSVDRAELDEMCGDPRAHLILEPLRWALALRPEWVACEQVEPCLPLWETMAACLRHVGYMTWTGVLSAECFGVPQTRRRAFLLASLRRQPERPAATHQRYVPPRVKPRQEESLFEAPEPERIVLPEDRGLEPWVSMAQALGWGMTARPYLTVASGRETGGPDREKDRLEEEWSADRPADAVTSRVDRWQVRLRANAQPNAAVRSADEPAPTITGGHDTGDRVWVNEGAVRVSVAEAAVLQGFPADYPWQGTRTAVYRQIGDAVPPPLARAVLAELER